MALHICRQTIANGHARTVFITLNSSIVQTGQSRCYSTGKDVGSNKTDSGAAIERAISSHKGKSKENVLNDIRAQGGGSRGNRRGGTRGFRRDNSKAGGGRNQGNQRRGGGWNDQRDSAPQVEPSKPQHVFQFSFDPNDRELVLRTGAVAPYAVSEVRRDIEKHTDFSDIINQADRKEHPVENYFMTVVATGLAKNPSITAEDKEDIIRTIFESLLSKQPK